MSSSSFNTQPFIRRWADWITELPGPEETWTYQEAKQTVGEDRLPSHAALRESHVFHVINRDGEDRLRYRVRRGAYRDAREKVEESGMLPCGHNAFHNLRGQSGVECLRCGERYPTDAIDMGDGP